MLDDYVEMRANMRFVIVTGMSGAGKSSVLKMLEDLGYFCVDNLPVHFIPKMTKLMVDEQETVDKMGLGIDVRNLQGLSDLDNILDKMKQEGYPYEVLFLEADDSVLVKRYKETRRNHPLALQGRVDKAIAAERVELAHIKKRADYILDTSHMLVRELKHEVDRIFLGEEEYENFFVTLLSFGFKYGIPEDSDLVFDVRFLPNPYYYIEELRPMSGNDQPVRDYVMNNDTAKQFLTKLTDMVEFLIPNYISEGKTQLVIGIGCTGGKHRSVTLANELYEALKKTDSYGVRIEHRDIGKDAITKAK